MVKAGQLSMLMTRSYGLKEVYNPFASADGVDPEKLGQARQNCPLTVLTLDRVVSLRDFEDFARAFPGIEKARADWVWDGETRKVFLTIAAAVKDITVDENSMLHCSLRDAVKNAGNGCQPFNIESYEPLTFSLEAKIHIDPRFIKEKVINQVKATLIRVYSFEQRQLAQPVTKSEVMAVIQGVDGVDAVDLDKLYIDNTDGEAKNPKKYLAARRARCNQQNEQTAPAELLTLNPSGIEISLMEIVQ
jgi:predicted phage baseplate assembly protein